MKLDSVPDPGYEILKTTERPYRSVKVDQSKDPLAYSLSTYRSTSHNPRKAHSKPDEDEPMNLLCGIETMFAGVFDD
jgi:hypothetical protein